MSGFTPGLWKAVGGDRRMAPDFEVRSTSPDIAVAKLIYNEADARLIAAAPDLYEALRRDHLNRLTVPQQEGTG